MGAITLNEETKSIVLAATPAELAQLLPGEVKYLRRRFIDGRSRAALARSYDVPIGALEHLEERAIRKLRHALDAREPG